MQEEHITMLLVHFDISIILNNLNNSVFAIKDLYYSPLDICAYALGQIIMLK